jgi:type IV pilus assembly protein PilW
MNAPCCGHGVAPRRRVQGFSLIELMVAMAIGLLLLAAMVTVYVNGSQSNAELEKSVRQIESGRYAMDLLGEDISMSGYYGDLTTEDMAFQTVGACETALANLGWNNATSSIPVSITGLDPIEASALACLTNHKADTPALVIRRVDTTLLAPTAATDGSPYVQTSRCESDPVNTKFIVGTTPASFSLRNLGCTAPNGVYRYMTRIYYVSTCNECGLDTVPTLKRAELRGGAMVISPLAEGVEDMAFEFAFDLDGNGAPDVDRVSLSGVAGDADNDWSNVVGTRVYLLTRTTEASPGFTSAKTYNLGLAGVRGPFPDNFKRRVYAMTNRLNNVAGPRELP